MRVEILDCNIDPNDIIDRCKDRYPDLNISNSNSDFKRLIKKLIKEKHILLKIHNIQFGITCPIFVYYQIKDFIPVWSSNIHIAISNDMTFESSEDFNSEEESNLMNLFKKMKTCIKDLPLEKAKYFLMLSSNIEVLISLDILQVYELLSRISKQENNTKIREFESLLKNRLFEHNNLIFNDQLLSVFDISKEQTWQR
jgi:hypothetical protein